MSFNAKVNCIHVLLLILKNYKHYNYHSIK